MKTQFDAERIKRIRDILYSGKAGGNVILITELLYEVERLSRKIQRVEKFMEDNLQESNVVDFGIINGLLQAEDLPEFQCCSGGAPDAECANCQ